MAGHFQAAPLLLEHAVGADQEGAALDALDLLAVHDLVLDHAEHVAHLLFGVGDQLERQFQLGLEVVVRLHVVARDAEHLGAGLDEVLVLVAELHGLGGAAGRVVLGVEIQNHRLAQVSLVADLDAAGGHGFKFGNGFVDNDCHAAWTPDVGWWRCVGLPVALPGQQPLLGGLEENNPLFYPEPGLWAQVPISSAAITRRPSPARMLKVRQAAAVSMVSTPMRRSIIGRSTAGGRNCSR
jgi:hypothetical protein